MKLTKPQQLSLMRKYDRDSQGLTYLQFRRSVMPGRGYVMVEWCGMWLGIEPDGHTHS